jgi:hypothetical protein
MLEGACERPQETVKIGDEIREVPNEETGEPPEVRTWGKAIMAGKADPR